MVITMISMRVIKIIYELSEVVWTVFHESPSIIIDVSQVNFSDIHCAKTDGRMHDIYGDTSSRYKLFHEIKIAKKRHLVM